MASSAMVNDNHVASSQDTSDNEDVESANMTGTEDEELEEIKARVREMEEEAEKLKQMQDDILANASQSMFAGDGHFDPMDDDESIGGDDLFAYQQHLSNDVVDPLNDGSFLMTDDTLTLTPEEKAEIDQRSIFVGNVSALILTTSYENPYVTFTYGFQVDYSATADDLEKHFHGCGSINRVTILCDKYTGHPKGYADGGSLTPFH